MAALSEECVRERRSMTSLPPTYYLHVWFARRPLVASRAAILGCLLPAEADRDKFLRPRFPRAPASRRGGPVRSAVWARAPGEAQPAEHCAATSPDSVRLRPTGAGRMHAANWPTWTGEVIAGHPRPRYHLRRWAALAGWRMAHTVSGSASRSRLGSARTSIRAPALVLAAPPIRTTVALARTTATPRAGFV